MIFITISFRMMTKLAHISLKFLDFIRLKLVIKVCACFQSLKEATGQIVRSLLINVLQLCSKKLKVKTAPCFWRVTLLSREVVTFHLKLSLEIEDKDAVLEERVICRPIRAVLSNRQCHLMRIRISL